MSDIELARIDGGTVALHDARRNVRWTVELEPFEIGVYPVTEAQLGELLGETANHPRRPATGVSWLRAIRFCNAASEWEGLDPAYSFTVPSEAVVLDQKGCIYTPRVLGVRVGQTIEIVNSDPTLQNVHAVPLANQEFNKGQPFQGMRERQVFTVAEVPVRFMCNVHGWMAPYVGVVPHPFFAVTDEAGRFELKGLPPGTYTIEAWHEKFGRQTETVTVAERQTQTTSFTFKAAQ